MPPPTERGRTRWGYRPEALARHTQRRDQDVFPRLLAPRTFAFLWALLGLGGLAAGLLALTTVPVYALGTAVVVPAAADPAADPALLLLLPPDQLAHLHPGQPILANVGTAHPWPATLRAVGPTVLSPATARQSLPPPAPDLVRQPVAVAWAAFTPPPGLPPAAYLGSVYPVSVEIGHRRLAALLPGAAALLGEDAP